MRRKDREVNDLEEIKEILSKADVLRVAMNNGTYPYIFPVNFGFEMTGDHLVLFFHGAKDGTKHEVIRRDEHVSFEVDCGHMLMRPVGEEPCTSSFAYESVIGNGIIEKAAEEEKERLLIALLNHYGIEAKTFHPAYFANTVVYKITAENYTAKRSQTAR